MGWTLSCVACEARASESPEELVGAPAGIRARWGGEWGGGRSGVRSAELLDTWRVGLVLPASLGVRKGAWPSPTWEESRPRGKAHPCLLQRQGLDVYLQRVS